MRISRLLMVEMTLAGLALSLGPLSPAAEEASRLVREGEARTAEHERMALRVPEGFAVELFADDKQLGGKPINMAFDAKGQLWVSSTQEYPYAVPKERWSPDKTRALGSKDSIRILADTDGDGRADKITVFADQLNIPTGVLPYKNGCIAWSIPNILHLEDTDGDGRCDKRSILFGPLGYEKDTHGMISSLRLGLDGWVYATHGFSNTSHIRVLPQNRRAGADGKVQSSGQQLELNSGNVFRFQPDGSGVELWTAGQVNPFGLCWDSWGNLYSADCHSSPIYQLIRGGVYPSFGKPHDGLGFAPVMCEHAHGSTGICGPVYIDGGVWGAGWDDHMLVCNPVTSKINHDHITFTGTTPKANELPDFLTSDDPWFRPVDLQLGPDSALYIADFYNRIIGHYEVPLDHPGRDRASGRIWRVVKHGSTGKLKDCDLSTRTATELMDVLRSSNLTLRYRATEELINRIGRPALPLLRMEATGEPDPERANEGLNASATSAGDETTSYTALAGHESDGIQDVHALWAAARLGDKAIAFRVGRGMMSGGPALEGNNERLSVAAISIITEQPELLPHPGTEGDAMVLEIQYDARGSFSMRAGALGMVRHPSAFTNYSMALFNPASADGQGGMQALDPRDTSLDYAWRMAIRALLSQPGGFRNLAPDRLREDSPLRSVYADIASTIPSAEAAGWLLNYVRQSKDQVQNLPAKLSHIARHLPASHEGELVKLVQEHVSHDLESQMELYDAIREGQKKSNRAVSPGITVWRDELTQELLKNLQKEEVASWQPVTIPSETNPNPWIPVQRECADGVSRAFFDSHPPGGEKLTGSIRSAAFATPPKLAFWLAGHRGMPPSSPHVKNYVRLVESGSGRELIRSYPPRHDVAKRIEWDLSAHQGIQARLELVDEDSGAAYAWLAAGGFEPSVAVVRAAPQLRDKQTEFLSRLCLENQAATEARVFLQSLPEKAMFAPDTREALAAVLASVHEDLLAKALVPLVREAELAHTIFAVLEKPESMDVELKSAFSTLPFRAQVKCALALVSNANSAKRLLTMVPPSVLADPLVTGKLKSLNESEVSRRLEELTSKLPPPNAVVAALISRRLKEIPGSQPDITRGQQLFLTNCSACHRIGVAGNLVGPQLDGIGARGPERLLEDILDPNRSVDPAFRLHFWKHKDGSLLAGLFRGERDGELIYADAAGQEHKVKRAEIVEDKESEFSLMPAGYGDILSAQDVRDLLGFLLERKGG